MIYKDLFNQKSIYKLLNNLPVFIKPMKNQFVGYLIVIIAVLLGFIILSFNMALVELVSMSCTHGETCPMWGTISFQTNVSIGVMIFVFIIGVYLIFFGREEKIVQKIVRQKAQTKTKSKKDYKEMAKKLKPEEKVVFANVAESDGVIFQSDLVDKTGFSKVKVTRILDKLEAQGLIERKRRGMSNVIIIKNQD